MAMIKTGSAALVTPGIEQDRWIQTAYDNVCSNGQCRIKTAKTVIAKYNPKKYLLSHCTIIAAVDTDLAESKDPKSNYLIKPEFSKFVNNNGDAWTKDMLAASYRSFIGSNNYLEHVQIPELSKGKVIDAVLRDIPLGKDRLGNDISTFYVDILVATDRKHKDLVRKIEAKELDTLSMGCVIAYSICSKCGNRAVDESDACQHVRYMKNNTFYDDTGVERKIAELCGHHDEPESVKFVDASWVKTPAFTGAVRRDEVTVPSDIMAKLESAHKVQAYKVQEDDFLKAAHVGNDGMRALIAAEGDEENPPAEEPPADTPEDAPADDETVEAPPAEAGPEDVPDEGMPEEPEQDDISAWKDKIKNKLLQEMSDEIADEFAEKGERPQELETLDESLIKPASVIGMMESARRSWDRHLKASLKGLDQNHFNKLRHGTWMLITSNDANVLTQYGFNKRDFLAVLSYLDTCSKNPLGIGIKKEISKLGGTQDKGPVELLSVIVSSIGRKLSESEASRSLTWLKMLDLYKK